MSPCSALIISNTKHKKLLVLSLSFLLNVIIRMTRGSMTMKTHNLKNTTYS